MQSLAIFTVDWTVRITDLASLIVVALSPFLAIWATEKIKERKDARARKLHIFRALMTTRQAILSPAHVEALNLIDIEYDPSSEADKPVVDAWRLYHAHLNQNINPANNVWGVKQADLLIDLMHTMAVYLKFPFNKSHLQTSSYYPRGYGEVELEQTALRKAALSVLEGRNAISVQAPNPKPHAKAVGPMPGK